MQEIQVNCTISRYWLPSELPREGEIVNGTLIALSTQTAENGKLIPVGIVILDSDDFYSIPMEFIQKAETE